MFLDDLEKNITFNKKDGVVCQITFPSIFIQTDHPFFIDELKKEMDKFYETLKDGIDYSLIENELNDKVRNAP